MNNLIHRNDYIQTASTINTQNITNATYTIDLLLPQEDVLVDSSVEFNVLMLGEKIVHM